MSGFVLAKPYANVKPKPCPICGRLIKNFEAHTRNREDHKELRDLAISIFWKKMDEYWEKYHVHPNEFEQSGMYQRAWDEALKHFSVSPIFSPKSYRAKRPYS
jgi:hypothetical protein